MDSLGNLYVLDSGNSQVYRIDAATGLMTTLAGVLYANGNSLGDGGPGFMANFGEPNGIAVDQAGNVFIADSGYDRVRELRSGLAVVTVNPLATVLTLAPPTGPVAQGQPATLTATVAGSPQDAATPTGGSVTFSDNGTVLAAVPLAAGKAVFVIPALPAGTNRITAAYSGDGVDYLASATAVTSIATISTAAGTGVGAKGGDGGPATSAEVNGPAGVAVNAAGDIFIADTGNNVIRKVDHATGLISTVAGSGASGYSGDGGAAMAATLANPNAVAVDAAGDIFIADTGNNVIREVLEASGKIITVAGTGTAGFSGDGGKATAATLSGPLGIAVDAAGDLFIADTGNNRIREVQVANGDISTVAGNGTAGASGDGGAATAAELERQATLLWMPPETCSSRIPATIASAK